MTILASTDSASPLSTAFLWFAVIVAAVYFGWRLFSGIREERAKREDADAAPDPEPQSAIATDAEAEAGTSDDRQADDDGTETDAGGAERPRD